MESQQNCPSCGTPFLGLYCHVCGEKKLEKGDFSVTKIMGDALSSITNLDSKFLKTFLNIFNPGFLTSEYLKGKKKLYMKPFQVFIISNLIFFILLIKTDILREPASFFFNSPSSQSILQKKINEKNISRELLAVQYDAKSSNMTKGLVIILIPFLGIFSYMINFNKESMLGQHFIFSTHFLSYFLMICVLLILPLRLLIMIFPSLELGPRVIQISVASFITFYILISFRKLFKRNWIITSLKTFAMMVVSLGLIALYRHYISLISLYLT